MMKKSEPPKIFLHCSASSWGNSKEIDKWHRERGWRCIGYHYVICNPYPLYTHLMDNKPKPEYDGKVQDGRFLDDNNVVDTYERGAHVKGFNTGTIGICFIGQLKFTVPQFVSGIKLVAKLCQDYGFKPSQVWGHYEADPAKPCPIFSAPKFRNVLEDWIDGTINTDNKPVRAIKNNFKDVL